MPKVSVIIPCYNAANYVDKCMETLLRDKLAKEIIFINDGSTDNTLEILNTYHDLYNNIIIINQKNSGQGIARNKGLKAAKGKYIFFLDIDDCIAPNALSDLYNFAQKNNYDYVYCDYYEHYREKDILIKNFHAKNAKKNAILANFAPWGKLISKELLKEINFKFCENKIFEDIAVIPHLAASSVNPGYLKQPLYYYNMTNQSTTRTKAYNKKYEDIIYVSDYMYSLFKNSNMLETYHDEIQYIYLDSILKSGVLKFAKYKEGLSQISILRNNVNKKFPHLINNIYFKQEKFYRKLTAFISIYFPPFIIYFIKKIK